MNLDHLRLRSTSASGPSPVLGDAHTGTPRETEQADVVIIGNGIAGLSAALEARRLDGDAQIVLVTEQHYPTLFAPALKHFLAGKLTREQLLAYPLGTEQQQRIGVIVARVEQIQASSQRVVLSNGSVLGYRSLLLATGSTPKGLPEQLLGRDFDGVVTLHSLESYLDLRRRLCETQQLVVVGGGLHGLETVMSLLAHRISVHWLIRSPTCLPHSLDEAASRLVIERVRRLGAQVTTGVELVSIIGRVGAVVGVRTTKHGFLPSQVVVACTGTRPQTTLAAHCDLPLHCGTGVLVDEQFRTSVPSVYAAGDVAELPDTQEHPERRWGHWDSAEEQGKLAAAAVMGKASSSRSRLRSPCISTRVGKFQILAIGDPLGSTTGSAAYGERTTRGMYRRVTMWKDQVIGYLWIGPAASCPDPLPIQNQIDQERGDADDLEASSLRRMTSARQSSTEDGQLLAVSPERRQETLAPLHGDPATETLAGLSSLWGKAATPLTAEEAVETFGAEAHSSPNGSVTTSSELRQERDTSYNKIDTAEGERHES